MNKNKIIILKNLNNQINNNNKSMSNINISLNMYKIRSQFSKEEFKI